MIALLVVVASVKHLRLERDIARLHAQALVAVRSVVSIPAVECHNVVALDPIVRLLVRGVGKPTWPITRVGKTALCGVRVWVVVRVVLATCCV